MKWFFAVTEATLSHADHDFPGLMKAAVASARMNTTLEPNLIYDGAEIPLVQELRSMGVNIIHHQLSIGQLFRQRATPEYPLAIALGAYLRTDIPDIEMTDDLVLYTDCDVLFLKDPKPPIPMPTYFACAPEGDVEAKNHINTGVMWMNLGNLRQDLPVFRHYMQQNFLSLVSFDQDAYINFYMGRWDRLPATSNWKPYWTINPGAEIVHFHGPKPMAAKKRMADPDYRKGDTWGKLLDGKEAEYRHYVAQWDLYRAWAENYIATNLPSS